MSWRQDIVLLVGLKQRGAFRHALNQQGNALFGERLRAGCADSTVDAAAKGQPRVFADLIILQFAAADAHPE